MKDTLLLKAFERFLVVLLFFLIPSQLAYHFWPPSSFIFGIRVDYLSPAVYLTDLLIFFLFSLAMYRSRSKAAQKIRKYKTHIFAAVIFILLNIAFSVSPLTSLFRWLKILEAFGLFAYIRSNKELMGKDLVPKALFYSIFFFSLIGIAQFILGKTLGGPFYLLGERNFTASTPGIALTQIAGREFMRAYSTFSHPNSFAGYTGAVLLFLIITGFFKKSLVHYFGFLVIITSFLLTFSLSSFLALGVILALILLAGIDKKLLILKRGSLFFLILISLLLPLIGAQGTGAFKNLDTNLTERLNLSVISGQMIKEKFLIGTGLGGFIINMPKHFGSVSGPRLLQPVHNIFLLALSEMGITGFLILCFIFYVSTKSKFFPVMLFIILTGVFDHYWLTLQQNTVLLAVIFGMVI